MMRRSPVFLNLLISARHHRAGSVCRYMTGTRDEVSKTDWNALSSYLNAWFFYLCLYRGLYFLCDIIALPFQFFSTKSILITPPASLCSNIVLYVVSALGVLYIFDLKNTIVINNAAWLTLFQYVSSVLKVYKWVWYIKIKESVIWL